jgi:L-threonylcarbamoyladenylate synthase
MQIYSSITQPEVAKLLSAGKVGVIPCDTVYGLVARAADEAAVAKLYALKHRDHKPGTLIGASIGQLVELGIPRRYLTAVQQFWPGAVSVETPHHIAYLTQSTGRQAIRIPDNAVLLTLLAQTGPLQTTSANQPDEPTATTIAEAQAYFGEHVDFYVDGGDMSGHLPSTIVRVIDDELEVVRQGAVTIDT